MNWISVHDKTPDEGVLCVACREEEMGKLAFFFRPGQKHSPESLADFAITHWLPIPEFPTVGDA